MNEPFICMGISILKKIIPYKHCVYTKYLLSLKNQEPNSGIEAPVPLVSKLSDPDLTLLNHSLYMLTSTY